MIMALAGIFGARAASSGAKGATAGRSAAASKGAATKGTAGRSAAAKKAAANKSPAVREQAAQKGGQARGRQMQRGSRSSSSTSSAGRTPATRNNLMSRSYRGRGNSSNSGSTASRGNSSSSRGSSSRGSSNSSGSNSNDSSGQPGPRVGSSSPRATPHVPKLEDSPYKPGTPEAKQWWNQNVVPKSKAAATLAMKAQYGPSLRGMYRGRPLRPGPHPGDQDFAFLRDSLIIKGMSPEQATRVAGKTRWRLYPN